MLTSLAVRLSLSWPPIPCPYGLDRQALRQLAVGHAGMQQHVSICLLSQGGARCDAVNDTAVPAATAAAATAVWLIASPRACNASSHAARAQQLAGNSNHCRLLW
eukprot:GHRR01007960.1.p4 GENE.GHRR01007960.1~~GHRR01007960.1.p4  ORF type:complete len:105 (+),score=40.24 GHRR01007960.1:1070-1384(+)